MSYCSLHNHTEYSNLRLVDSINKVNKLIDRAVELNLTGLAITDHEALCSHVKAIKYRKKLLEQKKIDENFKLILGNEIYLINNRQDYIENYDSSIHKFFHFLLLAKDKKGYEALKILSSIAWTQSFSKSKMERVPTELQELKEVMKDYKGHVIASSACLGGYIPFLILKGEKVKDENEKYECKYLIDKFIKECINIFGKDDFYLEMQPSFEKDQIIVNKTLKNIATAYNLKTIFTTDSHYLSKNDRFVHKAYLNSKDGEREVDSFYASTYMMSLNEIKEYMNYFDDEYIDYMVQNTIEIQNKCENYDLYKPQFVPTIEGLIELKIYEKDIKDYEYLEKMYHSKSLQDRYWVCYCINSMKEKKLYSKNYLIRLNAEAKELWLISDRLGIRMTTYYNTMQTIINLVWDKGDSVVGPARGSATGFLSCYLLEITQVNPMIWSLPLWRHLSSTRPELPKLYWAVVKKEREPFYLMGVA